MAGETQKRILIAAERLFAQRGFAEVSVRDIVGAAGQRNISAVHYYFGSKQGLTEALLRHRMRAINERRAARLHALVQNRATGDLRALVEAWVYPLIESLEKGSYYARFIARALARAPLAQEPANTLPETEALRRVEAHLQAALRHLPVAIRRQRLRLAARVWTQAAAAFEQDLEEQHPPAIPNRIWAEDLVNMIVGMLSAPVPPGARRVAPRGPDGRPRDAEVVRGMRRCRDSRG